MTNKWKDGLPPVGEECEITVLDTDGLFRNCKILYIDSMSVVFSSSAASSMPKYLSDVKFRPLKKPEEVERERVVELAFKTLTIDNSDLTYKICQDLYDAGLLTDKKVKPLSYQDFIELINKGWSYELMYEDLIENKHILRGSIEND
tara:strand:- start:37082 stop:37522 length:441 start_codon:yes stop_codon:yes gene_type:complete